MCSGVHCLADGGRVAARPVKTDIAGRRVVQLLRLRRYGAAGIDDSRQGRIIDVEKLGGIERLLARPPNYDGDRLADVADALARECPTRRLRHRFAIGAADRPQCAHRTDTVGGHVGAAENGDHARRGRCLRSIDVANDRMRVRGTNDRAIKLAGNDYVGDEAAAAAQKPPILDAADRCADSVVRLDRRVYCSSSRNRPSRS
jgi:hypothetical protein